MILQEAARSPLAPWENFYVIVGSSAGALTSLQFVVIALIAEARAASSMLEIRAFGTPTVVHFCAALLISAIVSAPWHTLSSAGFALGPAASAASLMPSRPSATRAGRPAILPTLKTGSGMSGFR